MNKVSGKGCLIEKKICRDIIKPNIIKSENDIKNFKEKIIFPYLINKSNIELIKEDYFKKEIPEAYNYLSDYKERLLNRDKGVKNYSAWYTFGRM